MTRRSAALVLQLACLPLAQAGSPSSSDSSAALQQAGTVRTPLGQCEIWLPADYSATDAEFLAGAVADLSLVLSDRLGPVHPQPFQLVITADRAQFDEWTGRRLPEWIQALALESPSRLVISNYPGPLGDAGRQEVEQVLLHELTHAYLHRARWPAGRTPLPAWFHEGLAVEMSGGLSRDLQRAVLWARWTGRLQRLRDLRTIRHQTAAASQIAYAQSALALQYLTYRHGESARTDLLAALGKFSSFERAYPQTFGEPLISFEAGYLTWLRQRYNLLLLASDPATLFMLLPALMIVAYLATSLRTRRRKAQWAAAEQLQADDSAPPKPDDPAP